MLPVVIIFTFMLLIYMEFNFVYKEESRLGILEFVLILRILWHFPCFHNILSMQLRISLVSGLSLITLLCCKHREARNHVHLFLYWFSSRKTWRTTAKYLTHFRHSENISGRKGSVELTPHYCDSWQVNTDCFICVNKGKCHSP